MRHGDAPGVGDPAGWRLDDCTTQRNLSEQGRAQARAVGARLRSERIAIERVLSSPWCRCVDTATLASLGRVEIERFSNAFVVAEQRAALRERGLAVAAQWRGPGVLSSSPTARTSARSPGRAPRRPRSSSSRPAWTARCARSDRCRRVDNRARLWPASHRHGGGAKAMSTFLVVHGAWTGRLVVEEDASAVASARPRGVHADLDRRRRPRPSGPTRGRPLTHVEDILGVLAYRGPARPDPGRPQLWRHGRDRCRRSRERSASPLSSISTPSFRATASRSPS